MEKNKHFAKTFIIPDLHYKDTMNRKVIPRLSSLCRTGYLTANDDTGRLYYEAYRPDAPVGALVISHGFCENAEKYKEVIYYFVEAGFQVYLADHRGHGRSLRDTGHPNMVHINSFYDYVNDLHTFVTQIVKPSIRELPLYLYAHSMGGAIGALYMETYPDTFQKAVLSSPMLGISLGPVPAPCARALGRIMISLHREEAYAIGQHPYDPDEIFEESCFACHERFSYYQAIKKTSPLFQNCGCSYGWAFQSLNACRLLAQKRNCQKLTVPILVFQSQNDHVVKASAIRHFVKNVPSARLIKISGSRHEIYNSPAAVLKDYYRYIFHFLC